MAESKHLFTSFQPEHYDVFIDINRANKTFAGKVTMKGNASTTTVGVHQKFLTIKSVTVNGLSVAFTDDPAAEAFRFDVPATGDNTVTITYNGPLTDTMMGIYPSYYEINGEKKELIGTQFETTSARQAFPCIDEPEAKATFDLAIKYDEHAGETTLANMPEVKCEDGVHYFATTKRMSSYLIAFAFGELQGKTTETKSGVKVGVFGTKAHAANELDFALDIAKRSIEFFEDFYQTPYPLPHSWQLALPDFSAGAMENWGLVTYREAYLLLDPDNTALRMKQLVATVIAHELAHQWFGDLVTMKWWDDIWLNESFANMMEYVAIDAIEPDWKIWEMFQTSEAVSALNRDATDGVQSVHVEVEDPAEIDSLFDGAIVYAKGSRMLVMVRALIGNDALRKGLKAYFDAHKYGNAKGADLWSALGAASGIDVGAIMHDWLEQPGYPVVSASVVDGKLTLSQQQFFIGDGKDIGRQWQIPLESNYSAAPQIMADKTIELGDYKELRAAAGKPFRLNVGNNSHFIVKYDQTLLDDILANVQDLTPIDEMQTLQDLRFLAEGHQVAYADLVPLLPSFAGATSTIANNALYSIAGSLRKFVDPDTEDEANLRQLFGKLTADQFKRLGIKPVAGEVQDDEMVRPTVADFAIFAKNADAIAAAHELFTASKDDPSTLPASVRPIVLASEVKNFGTQALFDQLLHDYVASSDPSYKSSIRAALTGTKDTEFGAQLIAKLEDAAVIKPQDLRAWYYGLLANNHTQQQAWDWLRGEWSWLEATVGGDMEFTTYITVTANAFRTHARLDEFKAFFEPKLDVPGLGREIQMDTKVIEARVALIDAEKDAVRAALR